MTSGSSLAQNFCTFVKRLLGMPVLVYAVIPVCASVPTRATPIASAPAAVHTAVLSTPAQSTSMDIQLADEIVRRLKRLGIQMDPSALIRPYDPEGEIC